MKSISSKRILAKKSDGGYVVDPSRRKAVKAGPEERVRQSTITFLREEIGVPLGLISVEKGLNMASAQYRADIVVHDRNGKPWMIIECKAPHVNLTQATFDQVSRYNLVVGARFLLITNGNENFCCETDVQQNKLSYLDRFPIYPDL